MRKKWCVAVDAPKLSRCGTLRVYVYESTFSLAVLVIPINEEMARDAAECILETRLPENAVMM